MFDFIPFRLIDCIIRKPEIMNFKCKVYMRSLQPTPCAVQADAAVGMALPIILTNCMCCVFGTHVLA